MEDNKPGKPNHIVANWTDTILYQESQVPVRGFGGRLIFYADGKKDPVKIEGTLIVYAFDEKNRDAGNVKPDRKFIFTKDQLAAHYSKSKLGHSYSLWLPWDDAGGEQREISLIVRFMPEKGNVLVGEQTRHLLPGRTESIASKSNLPAFNPGNGTVQTVSYAAPMTPGNPNDPGKEIQGGGPRSMTTTTISLPASSVFKTPMGAGMNGGVSYPLTMPPTGISNPMPNGQMLPNTQMPYGQAPYGQIPNGQMVPNGQMMLNGQMMPNGQMPYVPAGAAANPSVIPPPNNFSGPTANPAINGGMYPMNSSVPRASAFQLSNRSGLGQPPAPSAPFAQSAPYRAPWQPPPSTPAFGPGAMPAGMTNGGYSAPPEVAGSMMY
jgi:hypothetical protein